MIRRDWMKWLGFAAFAAPIGFLKSAEAAEPDWRDELLIHIRYHTIYYKGDPKDEKNHSISIYNNPDGYLVNHHVLKWAPADEGGFRHSIPIHNEYREFQTLEEAYKYAKELKAKYYA